MEIRFGSDVYRNFPGVLIVDGEPQIYLEIGQRNQQLLLTMKIYDVSAKHIAKLRRNAWVFNQDDRYEITTHPKSLRLIDKQSKETVVEAQILARDVVAVPHGRFYTHRGELVTITPEFCQFGVVHMAGNELVGSGSGSAVVISQDGVSIGAFNADIQW